MLEEARALNAALPGAKIVKVWSDSVGRLTMKLRHKGKNLLLLVSSSPGFAGIGLISSRPPSLPRPTALAAYLRAHAEGGALGKALSMGRALSISLTSSKGDYLIVLDAGRKPPRLFVLDPAGVVRASDGFDPPGGAVRPGEKWESPPGDPEGESLGHAEAIGYLTGRGDALLGGAVEKGEAEKKKEEGRWRRKLVRRMENIRGDLASFPDPDELRREAGELAESLWKGEGGVAGEDVGALYAKAKKAARAREIAETRLAEAEREMEGPPPKARLEKKARRAEERSGGFRRYLSSDGWEILVGRNRHENSLLLTKARPWDLWFHALGGSGAHVLLIKPGRDSKPPDRSVAEAAGLAAANSSLAGNKYVDVTAAEAARVKKPKGAGPGRVVVSGGRTLRVAPGAGNPKAADKP